MLASLMMLLCFQLDHSVVFMEKDRKEVYQVPEKQMDYTVFMENTVSLSWKRADKEVYRIL